MTPQEAIETIKVAIAEVEWNCPMDYAVAFAKAIEALKKQIPKKIKMHGCKEGRMINTISFTCPTCNEHIYRDNCCKYCGQALDWSDI